MNNTFAPSRVRGLKRDFEKRLKPYLMSFAPSRVRGLKHGTEVADDADAGVRTFTGAWIETKNQVSKWQWVIVRTFTGAWIETVKPANMLTVIAVRTFTGAWIETYIATRIRNITAVRTFTGAWIETFKEQNELDAFGSHLHGCVD